MKIKRITAGEYEMTDPTGQVWTISRLDFGFGTEWLVQTDTGVALDPLPTLRDAKRAVSGI